MAATGLVPPSMHWLVVMILSAVTYGLGALVWAYRQAFFVKKLDPSSKGVFFLNVATVGMVIQVVLAIIISRGTGNNEALLFLILGLNLVIVVAMYVGIFGMRTSLVNYYNTVEPIGLRLGAAMTFFFSIFYYQYHLSRIVDWKKTGTLKP